MDKKRSSKFNFGMKRIFLFTIATIFTLFAKAEKIDINVKSTSMNKMVSGYVITPDSYKTDTDKLFPCVYLLHGFGGSKNSWLHVKKDLQQISTKYNFVFVLPDVGNSWYIDSPLNKNSKYETFVAKELVEYINANFRVIKDRKGRGITGISMGGHGAISLAFKHPDTFGACSSLCVSAIDGVYTVLHPLFVGISMPLTFKAVLK